MRLSSPQLKSAPLFDHKSVSFELKAADVDGEEGAFSGYGAVFNAEDDGGDLILKGAFKKSLAAWKAKGKLPKMLLQHGGYFGDGMLPIGVWTKMEEDSFGLKVEGKLFALDTDRGKLVHAGIKTGALDGLSIGYRAVDFKWGTKPEEPSRTLKEINLYEVSIVLFGMNELATVTDVKSGEIPTKREMERMLTRDAGLSSSEAKAFIAGGFDSLKSARDAADSEDTSGASLLQGLAQALRS